MQNAAEVIANDAVTNAAIATDAITAESASKTATISAQPSRRDRLKAFWVDVFVMNTFSYVVAAPLELWIAGMSWQAHLQARLIGLLINSIIGRPYGLWREFLVARTGLTEASSGSKKYAVETLIFLSFQLPVYVTILAISGADWDGIVHAAGTACLIAGFLGRPYGIYLDFVRRKVGLPPVTATPSK
ncbi:MAG TPA: L-alanine exporter AlaE [Permianibacter sp.]|nr:L-alanine exporter AlaE [Permianibacter sp.]